MPAVVPPVAGILTGAPPTRSAAAVAAATSSCVQHRGAPSWCTETIASSVACDDRGDDLRREATVGVEHSLERGIVVRGAAVVLHDLPSAVTSRTTGWRREVHGSLLTQ